MKLSCKKVQDLYSQYLDGELDIELRRAIHDHLASCEQECPKLYGDDVSFLGMLSNMGSRFTEKEPPRLNEKKMRFRLMLRFLLNRTFLVITISILILALLSQYGQNRSLMMLEASQLADMSTVIGNQFSYTMDERGDFSPEVVGRLSSLYYLHSIYNYLNLWERSQVSREQLQFYESILAFSWQVNRRIEHGEFGVKDEAAVSAFIKSFSEIGSTLNNTWNNRRLFAKMDVRSLARHASDIREIAVSYLLYNRLPEEANVELAYEQLTLFPGFKREDIEVFEDQYSRGRFPFRANLGDVVYEGKVNAFNGQVIELWIDSLELGPQVAEEKIAENLAHMLEPMEWDFDIVKTGLTDSWRDHRIRNATMVELSPLLWDKTVLSFKVTPLVQGWPVTEGAIDVLFFADGQLAGILPFDDGLALEWPRTIDREVVFSPERALEMVTEIADNPRSKRFVETTIIRSSITGHFELVHMYSDVSSRLNNKVWYVNAQTGQLESRVDESWFRQRWLNWD